MVIGLVLIIIALYRMMLKGGKTLPMVVLPIFVFIGIGCSKSSVPVANSLIFVTPEVLDLGNVRPTDPPVEISFDVCNNSKESIYVTDFFLGVDVQSLIYEHAYFAMFHPESAIADAPVTAVGITHCVA
jgi:hypothetical protein